MIGQFRTPAIHVYTADGEPVASIQHTELGLQMGNRLLGIRCSTDGILHIAAGPWGYIDSLHVYKVS